MDLMDLFKKSGAGKSVGEIGSALGIGDAQSQQLVKALAPALTRGLLKQAASSEGRGALQEALDRGDHAKYINHPELLQFGAAQDDGNKILGHLFGSKRVSRSVAAKAAEETGIDAALIKKALPLVAGVAMGALGKSAAPKSESSAGADLGGLLGDLVSGGTAREEDFKPLLSLAKKIF